MRLPKGYGLLPRNNGDTISWLAGYVASRHNLMQFHCPSMLKLGRWVILQDCLNEIIDFYEKE